MFIIFLGGFFFYMVQVILCYFFEIEMIWGVMVKEFENLSFGSEILCIICKFKFMFVYCFFCMVFMICGIIVFFYQWCIGEFYVIYFFLIIVVVYFFLFVFLNLVLMKFMWQFWGEVFGYFFFFL